MNTLLLVLIAAQTADCLTTYVGLVHGLVEQNRFLGTSWREIVTFKAGITTIVVLLFWDASTPLWVSWVIGAGIASGLVAALHNLYVIRRAKTTP